MAFLIRQLKTSYLLLFPFIASCNKINGHLYFGQTHLIIKNAVHQEDPLGPLLLLLGIEPIIQKANELI